MPINGPKPKKKTPFQQYVSKYPKSGYDTTGISPGVRNEVFDNYNWQMKSPKQRQDLNTAFKKTFSNYNADEMKFTDEDGYTTQGGTETGIRRPGLKKGGSVGKFKKMKKGGVVGISKSSKKSIKKSTTVKSSTIKASIKKGAAVKKSSKKK